MDQALPADSSVHELVHADGVSDADRDALVDVHHRFLLANEDLVAEELKAVWSHDAAAVHFNTNGHTYEGLTDWLEIWDFYRPRFRRTGQYEGGRVWIWGHGDLAVIAAEKVARYKEWIGETEVAHNPPYYRATQVCRREDGEWRVIHAHFSPQADGPRPDQSGL